MIFSSATPRCSPTVAIVILVGSAPSEDNHAYGKTQRDADRGHDKGRRREECARGDGLARQAIV
jgi:hypothetical protein